MTDQRTTAGTADDPAAGDGPSVMAPAPISQMPASSAAATGWRDALPDPLRRVAEKFAGPAEVVKSYAALERRLGRAVVIPADDAAPEEIAAFYERLGRPPTPDGYRAVLPDGYAAAGATPETDARLSGFLAAVHEAGATPPVVRAALDWYERARAEIEADAAQRAATRRAEADAALRREWGDGFDRRLALARRAVRHFGGEDLASALERSGFGDDPAWVRAFARIGEGLAEDALIPGEPAAGAHDAQARIDAIMADHFGRSSYASPGVQSELRALYEALYGDSRGD